VPGPLQVIELPSPVVQMTDSGSAVAVAVTEPTVALTEYECQIDPLIHSQVGRFTTAVPAGLEYRVGSGRRSESSACSATVIGLTAGVVAVGVGEALEIQMFTVVVAPDEYSQMIEYQPPGVVAPGGGPTASLRVSGVVVQIGASPPEEPDDPPEPEPEVLDPEDPPDPPDDPEFDAPTVTTPPPEDAEVSPAPALGDVVTSTAQ